MALGRYPCLYNITYYNDVVEALTETKGFIYADCMAHASEILESYYGDIEEIHLKMYDNGLAEFDDETYEIVKNYMEGT